MSSMDAGSGFACRTLGFLAEMELALGGFSLVSTGTWKGRALAFVVFTPNGARVLGPNVVSICQLLDKTGSIPIGVTNALLLPSTGFFVVI